MTIGRFEACFFSISFLPLGTGDKTDEIILETLDFKGLILTKNFVVSNGLGNLSQKKKKIQCIQEKIITSVLHQVIKSQKKMYARI